MTIRTPLCQLRSKQGVLLALLVLIIMVVFSQVWADSGRPRADLINIKGGIGPATADYVVTKIEQSNATAARVIILQLDTPGGLSTSMRKIIKAILASRVPVIGYVAPAGARAASAGTYILYACQIAAMAPGTNLGAATPVSISPGGASPKSQDKKSAAKPSASELKALNDAKAYIRSLAQLRGRNVKWAEKAVSQASSLSAIEAKEQHVINFVAKDLSSLLQQASGKLVDVVGGKVRLNTAGLAVKVLQPNWRHRFLMTITDPSVTYVLLMIGFYGLFFEFANPGYVLPGVTGAIALLLALYAFQMLPVNYVGLGLIILGLIFFVAEAFMPSFGALGLGGVVALAFGSVMLFDKGVPGFGVPMGLIAGVTAVSAVFFFGLLYFVIKARHRPVVSGVEDMVGRAGIVVVNDRGIWLQYRGELWKIANPDGFETGDSVTITRVVGLKVEVTPV